MRRVLALLMTAALLMVGGAAAASSGTGLDDSEQTCKDVVTEGSDGLGHEG